MIGKPLKRFLRCRPLSTPLKRGVNESELVRTSGQQITNDLSVNVGEAAVDAVVAER